MRSVQRTPFSQGAVRCSAGEQPTLRQAAEQAQQSLREACGNARLLQASTALWALASMPANAADSAVDFSQGSASTGSYYATLFLFVATVPGLWSLVKRAPKASVKRKVYEVPGPAADGAMPLNVRAKQIFDYFEKYNYEVKERGEVITFVGNYKGSIGQASALVLYTFFGLGSAALVLSIAAPFGGSYWYGLTLIAPAAGWYYLKQGDRQEQFKVKMVTSDDELTTDILTEGDVEEATRFCRELNMVEKGKEYVKGIFEQ